jgi:hypothetical protein
LFLRIRALAGGGVPAYPEDSHAPNRQNRACPARAHCYEAAVLALSEFRRTGIAVTPGPGTRLRVEVKAPAVAHELSVGKLRAWLEGSGKTPAEQALKTRLKDILC